LLFQSWIYHDRRGRRASFVSAEPRGCPVDRAGLHTDRSGVGAGGRQSRSHSRWRRNGMKERVLAIVSQVLGVEVDALDESSSPDTIESWDSLNHMNLVLALEEEFGVQFSDDQIVQLLSLGAIINALQDLVSSGNSAGQR